MQPYQVASGQYPLFERAVDALIAGDAPTLQAMLREDPALIRARSTRSHHATLLHYVGTNGVEDERQRYPPNALEMLQLLLAAGADVDAEADMYGGGATTLGLVSTSIHPAKSGLMIPLLDTLLAAGAAIDHPGAGGNGQLAVVACLRNGRPEAAGYLTQRGAKLDLEGAAGVGRLDAVKSFFNEDGSLKDPGTKTQMEYGFAWACEFGHTAVVEYLLGRGMDPDKHMNGLTGLHWAILGGRPETIQLLIRRKMDLEKKNIYGGTALGAAFYAAIHSDPVYHWPAERADYVGIIRILLEAGARIEPGTLQWLEREPGLSVAMKSRIGEVLREFGAGS
ncbi:ankyrin repeat domain-containing protein [Flavitalea sp. BT771]|uniref:ankyrin repeat domain-containing protein n=1 Tax=Flavitalea sp. BT771 TaxID=3063329 RepID=UPI0026E1213F|nr:ankyrin repeat domain-containing protein [Flavitalea sp. BT771]MDO6434116.1 ankyrin repeat domain-containing protein [Flavitalea sp. BT771]MDV6223016.1 ankyrin repeat domain-containing protein [Flavitalea sp. BT771]